MIEDARQSLRAVRGLPKNTWHLAVCSLSVLLCALKSERRIMSTITPERIADIIADAPGWALARRELGQYVYRALYQPIEVETAQLCLQL
jgi:hypothetical protein